MTALRAFAAALAAASSWALAHDDHQHHAHPDEPPGVTRSIAHYYVPETQLLRADGIAVKFPLEIDAGGPVALNFIYTSCTAVCPILSASFAELQRALGPEGEKIRLVSISIDPEEDTPERLTAYAKRFDAGPQWRFYTGTREASVTLQKAFHAYFGDKMHHRPMTFLRAAPGEPWVRLEGFATPQDLRDEYRKLVAQ
jgi:protein SCO1/2